MPTPQAVQNTSRGWIEELCRRGEPHQGQVLSAAPPFTARCTSPLSYEAVVTERIDSGAA
jgi:hypothetical protein